MATIKKKKSVWITPVFFLIILILILFFCAGCVELEEQEKEFEEKVEVEKEVVELEIGLEEKENITLITLYDNYEFDPKLNTGWGFSCLIKTEDKQILFDTGGDSRTLLYNMEQLNISPNDIDIVVLSHIHGDHTGGLSGILETNPNVSVYIPSSFPDSFKQEVREKGAQPIDVSNEKQIYKNVYSTGELNSSIGLKEQSLFINTNRGIVVLTGCAHPGIVNIVKHVKKMSKNSICLVMGGFHLGSASESQLNEIINEFKTLEVEKAAPCHCSGDRARQLFKETYRENFIENGVGKIIEI